ncbi:MAG: tripartite tricarboxylate transporter substrate binding protein [Pseudomonadota bacterium]
MAVTLTRRAALAGMLAASATPAGAQATWPDRPVTIVHGLAPGGPSDIIARIIADSLTRRFGQQVIVDPRPGAGGRLATGQIARATPDGYTLMTIPSGHAVAAALYKSLPYDSIGDFSMISMLTEFPFILVVNAETEFKTFQDFTAAAKASGRPFLYGSAGNASLQHLAGELLSRTLNITFQHVPYRGSAQALTDLMAKRIDFLVDSPTAEMQYIRAGKARPLIVTSQSRFFGLPDVPTSTESGIPSYTFTSWQGMIGPAGMPEPLVDRLNLEIATVLSDPAVIERIHDIGNVPAPTSPKEFRARIVADIAKWSAVIEGANIEKI